MLKSSSLCLYSSNLGTFWLKIEQFWPFEEICIISKGGPHRYRPALPDAILNGDHLRIISAKFGWDWLSSFRGEDFIRNFLWTLNFYRFWPIMQLRKKGDGIKKNLLLWNYWANINQTLLKWSLGGPRNGAHLGYRTALTDTILKGDHLRIISAKFGWYWLSSFRGEDFFYFHHPFF
jgi:hypothetical protein